MGRVCPKEVPGQGVERPGDEHQAEGSRKDLGLEEKIVRIREIAAGCPEVAVCSTAKHRGFAYEFNRWLPDDAA